MYLPQPWLTGKKKIARGTSKKHQQNLADWPNASGCILATLNLECVEDIWLNISFLYFSTAFGGFGGAAAAPGAAPGAFGSSFNAAAPMGGSSFGFGGAATNSLMQPQQQLQQQQQAQAPNPVCKLDY